MTSDSSGTRHEFVSEADSDVRLDLLVAGRLGLSRTQAATLIAEHGVTVCAPGGVVRFERASYKPRRGETLVVVVPPAPGRDVLPEDIPLTLVHEDEHLLVVDKPAGMVVHPAPGNWSGTLVNALLGRGVLPAGSGEERPGIVHRIDKETSGLLIVARTDTVHRALSSAIASRRVVRRYAAMVWGHVDKDEVIVDKPVARDPRDRRRMAVVKEGKSARTTLVRLARFDSVDLLRAHLHTGRTHQIRVHLASIGHPVIGDDTYGGGGGRKVVALPPKRHFLHAAWLRFRHPVTGMDLDLRSSLPSDLRAALAQVARDPSLLTHADPLDAFGFYSDRS
ncbi:MAG TPA: RluA family pseudouridine synthase [Gemmatimonadaceae bacterium]|nr:RluA family pseudouridine synthase [Gemmatimonadaceae bacterium]